ncbi:MAG: hypothetical protein ACXW3E_12035 [Thermoanaerobaculia bacterium]
MDESVWVDYVVDRDVFVDGQLCGRTNALMTVETGTHTFDLGLPQTYLPREITKKVTGTTSLDPLVIKFEAEL